MPNFTHEQKFQPGGSAHDLDALHQAQREALAALLAKYNDDDEERSAPPMWARAWAWMRRKVTGR